eukprot:NODE_7283_length_777_cov_132.321101_g7042_i0.p1 GENE.NODE_7283_length_777_cov_132.321101_g7042_i0~~NODE_7283_length_777_cov_132.321101_g7042_i0.p1  ORF type:complete len:103 (+),score=20.44 NODE_7283_length_777_cov_132.321101_g7042_i0:241-549(+)
MQAAQRPKAAPRSTRQRTPVPPPAEPNEHIGARPSRFHWTRPPLPTSTTAPETTPVQPPASTGPSEDAEDEFFMDTAGFATAKVDDPNDDLADDDDAQSLLK